MPLFQVAIIRKPTQNEREDGKGDELVLEPQAVVAKDQQTASSLVAAAKPDLFAKGNTDQLEVLCRPF